jgi:hypothetical protein
VIVIHPSEDSVQVTLREDSDVIRSLGLAYLALATSIILPLICLWTEFSKLGLSCLAICAFLILSVWLWRRSTVIEESVLAVRHLGLQLSKKTRGGSIVGERFVSAKSIHEIYVLEGFTASRVITYIAIELVGKTASKKLVVPFESLNPTIAKTVEIMKVLRKTLEIDS